MTLAMNQNNLIHPVWEEAKTQLKRQLGQATFNSWIRSLEFISLENGVLKLSAPTKFIKDWVETHYKSKIHGLAAHNVRSVQIEVKAVIKSVDVVKLQEEIKPTPESKTNVINFPAETISSRIDKKYTFENFITASSNELAAAAAKKIAETGYDAGLNPLFLHSKVGLGKTHLMQAIGNHSEQNHSDRKVIYLSAEKFLHLYVRSLKDRSILDFKDELRSADILMIDDFQFIAGKESTQEEFFHTVSALVESGKQLIISCDRTPSDFENLPERMRSRLSSGFVVDIAPADYDLRFAILKAKAEQSGQEIPLHIMEFLAQNITANIRELEGALNRIIGRASLIKAEINIENVKLWIADLLKTKEKQVSIEDIQNKVAEKYGIKTSEILSANRSKNIARPRQIAMYLAKNLTTKSLADIGKFFGGKDHTTVMHACKKVEELIATTPETATEIEALTRAVKAS